MFVHRFGYYFILDFEYHTSLVLEYEGRTVGKFSRPVFWINKRFHAVTMNIEIVQFDQLNRRHSAIGLGYCSDFYAPNSQAHPHKNISFAALDIGSMEIPGLVRNKVTGHHA